jgi:hypothetical protein
MAKADMRAILRTRAAVDLRQHVCQAEIHAQSAFGMPLRLRLLTPEATIAMSTGQDSADLLTIETTP